MYPHTSGKGNGAEKMPRWCYFHLEICLPFNMLLLLLSHFSRVRLCATPQTAAHQAPPSLGFSRQKHWSGLPFPSPMQESEKWKWSHWVVSNSQDPMDCNLPGSSVHGIFQARVLEWGAVAFSGLGVRVLILVLMLGRIHQWSHLVLFFILLRLEDFGCL